jgi:hypothetical protein
MAEPLNDTDEYGLSTLARRWTPSGLSIDGNASDMMELLADVIADGLNVLLMLEKYGPIIWSPSRCDDADLERILNFNGIGVTRSLTVQQQRRLAILGSDLRSWRGAFRSLRAVVQALTGGPVVVRSWLVQRFVVDESSWPLTLLTPADHKNETDVFLRGLGENSEYDATQVSSYVDSLAKTVLDTINYLPCYVVTAWRDGMGNWVSTSIPALVNSSITNEFESINIGPDVVATATQFVQASTQSPVGTSWQHLRLTVFAATVDSTDLDFWEVYLFADSGAYEVTAKSAYVFRIQVGPNRLVQMYRMYNGTLTLLGSHMFNLQNGTDWRRLDFEVRKTPTATKMLVVVDGNTSFTFSDATVTPRPSGQETFIGLRTSQFTTGKLRLAAVLGIQLQG